MSLLDFIAMVLFIVLVLLVCVTLGQILAKYNLCCMIINPITHQYQPANPPAPGNHHSVPYTPPTRPHDRDPPSAPPLYDF
jgi:hypothetical protein